MNQSFFSILIFALCLTLMPFAFACTAPTTANQPLIISSNSDFYGSDKGTVTIDLNVENITATTQTLYFNLSNLLPYGVTISNLKVNGTPIAIKNGTLRSNTKVPIAGKTKYVASFNLNFNPSTIGFGKEFDIQFLNDDGNVIADLDPFLSGYNYRKQITITTPADQNGYQYAQVSFTENTQSLIAGGKMQADCDDARITYGESNTEIDMNLSPCNSATSTIKFVLQNKIPASKSDTNYFFYYGNSGASKYSNIAKNWQTMYDTFDTNTIGSDWNAVGGWNITGGSAISSGTGIAMFYNYRNYELPTDSVTFTVTMSDKGTFGNGNGKFVGIFDGMNNLGCGQFGFMNGYFQRLAQSTNQAGGIYRALNSSVSSLVALENSNWDSINIAVNNTTVTVDWTGGTGNPNSTSDATIRGTKKVVFGDADCVSAQWGQISAVYTHNTTASIGTEETNNQAPDINITSPTAGLNWNGTKSITFNALDPDATNTLDVNLFYSGTQGARTNLIYEDHNLADGVGITCSDYVFTDSTACTYSWDTTTAVDGQYYIDANINDGTISDQNSSPQFRVDNTKPVTTLSGCGAGWNNSDQTITLSCADTSGSGCNGTTYKVDGGALTTYSGTFVLSTDLNHQIDYNSIDNATNQEVVKTTFCAVDKTAPSVGATTFIGFVIFGSFINGIGNVIGGTATDILSGIDQATCEYTINGGGAWLSAIWNTDHCEALGITISDGTSYTGNTRVDDNAGNTGTGTQTGTYTGDTTAPTTTDDASNSWSAINETVTLTPSDGAGAGVQNTFYCIDATGTCTPTTIGTSVSVTCGAGNVCSQYVRYFSQDNVDNNETAHNSLLTRIDKENPTATSIAITDVAGRTEDQTPDLTISATDGAGAGLKEMAFSCNGSTWGAWITYSTSYSSFDLRTGAGCTTAYGNKTVYLKVRDNLDNESTSTNDTTLLDAPVTYGDLNVFQLGDYTHNVDLNINSDLNIVWQFNATSNDLNTISSKVFYQSPIDDANCSGYVQQTAVCGFQEGDYMFNIFNQDGTTFTMRSIAEDDHAFKPYFYNADPDLYAIKSATPVTLNSGTVWAKTLISNVISDANVFFNLSFHANFTGAVSRTLQVYDCNSNVADPTTSGSCWAQPFSMTDSPQLDGYFSIYHTSDTTSKVNGINLDADGNHYIYFNCPTCTGTQYWSLDQIDQNTNIDKPRNWTSTTGLGALSPNVRTIDAHLHALNLIRNNYFTFYFTIDNNQGKTYTSNQYAEAINQVNLAPHFDAFLTPTSGLYTGLIDVNIQVADPESNAITCDFNLVTPALAHVAVLAQDVSPVGNFCSTDLNSFLYTDGNYLVKARVKETTTYEKYEVAEYSENFMFDNTAPTITSIDGNGTFHTSPFYVNVQGVNFGVSGKASAQYRIDAGAWTNFTTDYNVHITIDGNYLIDFNFTDLAGNSLYISGIDANLGTIPTQPPTITVIQPNGGETYTKLVDTPTIIITLQDPDTNELYLDVNYSDEATIGTGIMLLVGANVLTSPSILCDSEDFTTDVNCSLAWNILGIPDGNYFIVVAVSDGTHDANDVSDAYFTIASLPPIPPSTDYVERYIAPDSKQRDTNIYFNPTSAFALSEGEKQTLSLQGTQTNIFLFGVIIIVILGLIAVVLWKRK